MTRRSDELSYELIGAAIEVHRFLGPGLLESAYEEALCYELSHRDIPFERQKSIPLAYKGVLLDCDYRIDLLLDGLVIVELKATDRIDAIHHAQLMTYLKLSELWLGMLLNFNVKVLKEGIHRLVSG